MSVRFVATEILSSADGLSHGETQVLETDEVRAARAAGGGGGKTLYEQLEAEREKQQEAYDANTKALFSPGEVLDAVACYQRLRAACGVKEGAYGREAFDAVLQPTVVSTVARKSFIFSTLNLRVMASMMRLPSRLSPMPFSGTWTALPMAPRNVRPNLSAERETAETSSLRSGSRRTSSQRLTKPWLPSSF